MRVKVNRYDIHILDYTQPESLYRHHGDKDSQRKESL